jgi:hypothetical protein
MIFAAIRRERVAIKADRDLIEINGFADCLLPRHAARGGLRIGAGLCIANLPEKCPHNTRQEP